MKEKPSNKAVRDLAAIFVVAVIGLVVAFYFDVFEEFQNWAQRYERWELDELVVVPLVFGLAFGFYSWRRWQELKVETSRREEAQSALEESEQRSRSLVQNAKDIIMLMNADGTVGYLNPAVEEMLGYKAEDIVGTNSFTPVHPDDDARVQSIFANAMSNPGVTKWMELRLQHADGSWRHIETYCTSLLHDPTVRGVIVNSRDVTERKQAEKTLQESEQRYRTLVEQVPAITYVEALDVGEQPDHTLLYVSPQIEAVLGYSVEEWLANPHLGLDLLHPEDRDRILEEDLRTERTGEPFVAEYRMYAKDGRVVWVYDAAILLRDNEGQPLFWQGSMYDVTERKRVEERRREVEERYRTLVEQIPVITYVQALEHDNATEYISPQVEDVLGYTACEYTSDPKLWINILHPDDRERVLAEDERTDETLEPYGSEYRMFAKDGHIVWVQDEAVVVRDTGGRPRFWQGVMLDITERRQAEEALRENEERFRLLAENAQDVIFRSRLQPTRQVEYISPSVTAMTGYEPEEYYADPHLGRRLVHPEDRQMLEEALHSTSGSPIVLRLIRKDGTLIWTEQRNNSIYDEAGEIVASVGIVRDITERKRAEEALRESEERHRAVVEQAGEGIFLFDPQTKRVLEANPAFQKMFGYALEELGHKTVYDLVPHDRGGVDRNAERTLEEGHVLIGERRYRRKDGSVVDVEVSGSVISYGGEEVICSVVRDVTERKRAEEAVRESEERYRAVVQQSAECMFLVDLSTKRILEVNNAYQVLLGYDAEEMLGLTLYDVVAHDRESIDFHIRRIVDEENHVVGERCYRRKDGSLVEVEVIASLISYSGCSALSVVAHDVTERKQAEEALRESEARHRAMLEASPDLVFRFSRDGEYLDFQANDESILSVPAEEIIGKNLRDTMPPDLIPSILRRITKALDTGEMQVFEYQLLVAEGIRDFEARLVVAGSGEVLAIVRDATERKALERRLEHRAFHDSLTGLPNRALFLDRLEHALARAGRHRESVAVLFVDLDNFKVVNDSLGHEAGDALLVAVAGRLREILRPEDTLARLSGDEFTVLLEDIEGTSDVTTVAERIAAALREPFILEGREAFATASMGIAFGGSSQESPGVLLRNADLAMYRAKETGKAHHEVFHPEMNERALKRLSLEGELRRALKRDELRVHYQPQVLLSTELQEHLRASGQMAIIAQKAPESPRIVGMEALVRWEHPERGLLSPGEFVPFAEENGLIVPIGRWVLEQACRQAKEWQEQHYSGPHFTMSVNVSTAQFRSPELVEDVARVLQETGLEAGMLTLEITESVLLEEAQANANTLEQLKALGVRLAIDDFGTGYSSLSYLKRLPVDYLKIDRSFVTNLGRDSQDRVLVSGVIYLAHGLGLKVIAEGVEKAEQLAQLQQMGCDLAQGYYFSRPLASEAATLLTSNSEPSFSGVCIDPLSRIDQS